MVGLTRIRILLYYIHNTHTYILYIIAREKKREREREKVRLMHGWLDGRRDRSVAR